MIKLKRLLVISSLLLAVSGCRIREPVFVVDSEFGRWFAAACPQSLGKDLRLLRQVSLEECYVGVGDDFEYAAAPLFNNSRSLYLDVEVPYRIVENGGEKSVEIIAPDSFVDLYDVGLEAICRAFSLGPEGAIHNVFWVTDASFLVVGVDEGEAYAVLGDVGGDRMYFYAVEKCRPGTSSALREYILSTLESRRRER
jgi:hypothetical protein